VSTATVVDEIKLKAPSWSAEGSKSILSMLNRAQNFALSKPVVENVVVDPLTGDYPFLITEAGKRDYEIPNTSLELDPETGDVELRVFKVLELFSEQQQIRDYNRRTVIRPYVATVQGGKTNYKFTPRPATELVPARIILPFDPGATTDVYKYKAILEPLQLTAITIPLTLDQTCEEMLICGALAFIEQNDYGRSDKLKEFKDYYCPRFWRSHAHIDVTRKVDGTPIKKF